MENLRKNLNIYKENSVLRCIRLRFLGIRGNFDVYNPSCAFEFEKEKYIFGRVEKRKDWADSQIMLFRRVDKRIWKRVRTFSPLKLEDPFVKKINGEFVLGGVYVRKSSGKIEFKTVFFRGKTPFFLKKFAEGPWGMKDIRLIELKNKKIGIFTRPQGGKYEGGKIGFDIFNSLQELNEELINDAKLISFPFLDNEWGGVNDAVNLKENLLGVLGHIAYSYEDGRKFYYPISFKFNIKKRKISDLRLFLRNKYPVQEHQCIRKILILL